MTRIYINFEDPNLSLAADKDLAISDDFYSAHLLVSDDKVINIEVLTDKHGLVNVCTLPYSQKRLANAIFHKINLCLSKEYHGWPEISFTDTAPYGEITDMADVSKEVYDKITKDNNKWCYDAYKDYLNFLNKTTEETKKGSDCSIREFIENYKKTQGISTPEESEKTCAAKRVNSDSHKKDSFGEELDKDLKDNLNRMILTMICNGDI